MPNKTIYDGEWHDGKLLKGKCTYPDSKTYDGEWLDGKPHGRGVKVWSDGKVYDGHWRGGKPYGSGTKHYPDGKSKEGYWDKGKFVEGKMPPGFQDTGVYLKDDEKNEVDDLEPLGHGARSRPRVGADDATNRTNK